MNDKLKILHRQNLEKLEKSGISDFDRKIIGGVSARLEIPLTDRYTLRKVPDFLRGLAATIENVSRREDLTDRTIMIEVKAAVREFCQRTREIHGIDKFNKNGTTKSVDNT